ncbi:MBL fold metallo-hydrolase [Lewinellaceae bacterium SD302]|nr:MBL fold metallo-hydrolase [Lewinellaceae bacterium SD302]
MQRRKFIRNATLGLAALGLSPTQSLLANQLLGSAGTFKVIRNNVGYYTEKGGTIGWLLSPQASVVIDTQFPEQSENLLSGLKTRQNFEQLDLLINTHHHGDHTGGNPVFAGLFKQHVAHANAKINQEISARKDDKLADILLPTETYTDTWAAQTGNEIVSLNYFGAGHTNGDSIIHFQNANVAHLGDLLFNRRFPYIDPGAGGNFKGWQKVLKKIRKYYDKDTIFIFGHAAENYPVTGSVADVEAMENYIKRLLQYVKKEKKKGTSLDQLVAKTTVIPKAEEWKYGERLRERNLRVAWDEV